MVDKIDRPEAPPAYQVVATTATKDNRGQSQPQQQEDEFSSPGTEAEWRRFHGRIQDRKLLKIRREDITRAIFRQALLQRRAAIVETDLELSNGQVLQQSQFLLSRLDEFWQWKGYAIGQEIPLTMLLREPYVEVSVPQHGGVPQSAASGVPRSAIVSTPPTGNVAPLWKLWDAKTGEVNTNSLMMYLSVLAVAIIIVVSML